MLEIFFFISWGECNEATSVQGERGILQRIWLLEICFLLEAPERAIGRTGGRGKGGCREKGSLGRAEMLKTETLKGRMLRWTPGFGRIGRFHGAFHPPRA